MLFPSENGICLGNGRAHCADKFYVFCGVVLGQLDDVLSSFLLKGACFMHRYGDQCCCLRKINVSKKETKQSHQVASVRGIYRKMLHRIHY